MNPLPLLWDVLVFNGDIRRVQVVTGISRRRCGTARERLRITEDWRDRAPPAEKGSGC